MNKQELIDLIEKLELPKDEYYILSSGSLALYNLREEVGDLDLCISKELFEDLKKKFGITEADKNKCGFYKVNDLVECVVDDKKDFTRDFREGYPVEKLESVLNFKKGLNHLMITFSEQSGGDGAYMTTNPFTMSYVKWGYACFKW